MDKKLLKAKAKEFGLRTVGVALTDLVRNVQAAEQNDTCFCTGKAFYCGQEQCLWRDACDR